MAVETYAISAPEESATKPILLESEADTNKLEQLLRSALEKTLEVILC